MAKVNYQYEKRQKDLAKKKKKEEKRLKRLAKKMNDSTSEADNIEQADETTEE